MKAHNYSVKRRTFLQIWIVFGLLGISVFGVGLQASGIPARQSVAVYLYDGSGTPTNDSSVSFYQEGHVFDIATSAQIGDVPNVQDGTIYDGNGAVIGFISPSERANIELSD